MSRSLDLYLIEVRTGRFVLFGPPEALEILESAEADRIHRFIEWLRHRSNRVVRWIGGVFRAAHHYYEILEDKIDPTERVLKTMASVEHLTIHFAPRLDDREAPRLLRKLLRRQAGKHTMWLLIDGAVGVVVILFTPILVPIPGPNVFFYYPALRWISHYRALKGARRGLNLHGIEFASLPQLAGLEENLRKPTLDRKAVRAMAEGLHIKGLGQFLERMV